MAKIILSEPIKIMAIVLTVVYFLFVRKKLCREMIRGEIYGWIIICVGYFVLKFYSQISLPSVGYFCRMSISPYHPFLEMNKMNHPYIDIKHYGQT